jgi:hypothetical protein
MIEHGLIHHRFTARVDARFREAAAFFHQGNERGDNAALLERTVQKLETMLAAGAK